MTIVLSFFPSLWQATICDLSRSTSISCKRRCTKFSRSFGATELSMPEKSKHSLLKYYSNLWCCLPSSTSLLLLVLKASCRTFEVFCPTLSWLINSSFLVNSDVMDVISSNFLDMSLFCCNKLFCCRSILSYNAKKDAIKFSLLIFSNCPLVRIFDVMISWEFSTLKSYLRSAWWSKRVLVDT